MAKKDTSTTEKTFKAKARQFIKYNGEYLKEGQEFDVKESDVTELGRYADIEIPKEAETPPVNPAGKEGEGVKAGV
ncbi:MAG: hypothetical protein LKE46_01835 [Clostridium sp.]|jgi:hypothetical protein|uniref:hypothetical protein n=1 Tax=Clostridium sp. TaxID=1506 RepID=UPI0025BC3E66|nr:hypothetical protein [Clostridium sp.]MCH3962991.1 hypothetical protein [Clostridium sp.]MCI1800200.1 hypothetical protein [Clostridium sp.]MCI2202070.1 hypothetical protein [Clostridium sp.]